MVSLERSNPTIFERTDHAEVPVNSRRTAGVQPGMKRHRPLATVWRSSVPLLCLFVHGCTETTGGAVELSWALRSTQDVGITDCAGGRIREIQLGWQTPDITASKGFPCDANHGTTAFELPPGPVTLTVVPTCEFTTGPRCLTSPTPCDCVSKVADSATFESPPPLVRRVAVGEIVTLDAVVMVIDAERICQLDLLCP